MFGRTVFNSLLNSPAGQVAAAKVLDAAKTWGYTVPGRGLAKGYTVPASLGGIAEGFISEAAEDHIGANIPEATPGTLVGAGAYRLATGNRPVVKDDIVPEQVVVVEQNLRNNLDNNLARAAGLAALQRNREAVYNTIAAPKQIVADRAVPMFTMRDMVDLSNKAKTDPIAAEQYNEVTKGGYLLSRQQAAENEARKQGGAHIGDAGIGDTGIGLPAGKVPSHVTFGEGSPFALGLAAQKAGKWIENGENDWTFVPNANRLQDAAYKDELARYYVKEYGNGINSLRVGEHTYTNPEQLKP